MEYHNSPLVSYDYMHWRSR